METVKSAVQTVSEVVFPGIKISYVSQITRQSEQVISSLPLQMCLYFNVNYSPFWLLTRIGCLFAKFPTLSQLHSIVLVAVLAIMIPVEAARLYLGYVGNLTEKVPELAGFWMLTLFLQFPLHSLSTFNKDYLLLPWERVMDIFLMVFLVLEIGFGYFALKVITKYQAQKFKQHMMKYKAQGYSTETVVE